MEEQKSAAEKRNPKVLSKSGHYDNTNDIASGVFSANTRGAAPGFADKKPSI